MARLKLVMLAIISLMPAVFAGCTVGPDYFRPKTDAPASYKEVEGWKKAEPQDHVPRGAWWEVFNDPQLNALEDQVNISNQNIATAEAQYRQAVALVQVARAGYFPVVSTESSATRVRRSANSSGTNSNSRGVSDLTNSDYLLTGNLSWQLDLWGKVRRTVESSRASAQASAADLEGVRLTVHAQLAQSYFQLRALDAQKQILDTTAGNYQKFLEVTKNRYEMGVASRSDVLQAETQLKTTQAQSIDTGVQRAQFEHSIALLMGKSPSELTIPAMPLDLSPPDIPAGIPSTLLERRPDIASAERHAAAANAQIGVAIAAYYPTLSLGASGGFEASQLAQWFFWPSRVWTLGPAVLQQTIFEGGLRRGQTEQARAAYDASAATYRQTVLTGFQQVEDNLAALRILEHEAQIQEEAVKAAQQSLTVTVNRYKAGIASALDVIITQTIALNNEVTAANILGRRMVACVLLVQALGGGWQACE